METDPLHNLVLRLLPKIRPDHLEEFLRSLVRECGVYAPDFDRLKRSVGYSEEDLRCYLGTYFPRSFLETYDISSELFRKLFGTSVRTDGELRILDLGCGLGGAAAGLVFAVLESFDVREIIVDGFDANEVSLRIFKRIFASDSFAAARAALRRLEVPGAKAEITVNQRCAQIRERHFDLLGDDSKYDVILTSKMLNELPVERKYFRFLETYLPHLSENGLCFVIDVNDRREGRHISQCLSEETLSFLGRHDGFECLLLPGLRKARVALRRIQSVRLPREQFRPLESSRGARRLQSLLPRLLPFASLPSLPSETHPFRFSCERSGRKSCLLSAPPFLKNIP